MSDQKAAPAAVPEQGSHNLLMRVAAASVLVPVTIAAAYAGGWLWTALVTLVAIGLYLEWLTVVGAAHEIRVTVSGSVALAIAGWYLAAGQINVSLAALALGLAVVVLLSPRQRRWTATGFLYAAAAQTASVLVRLDQADGFVALMFVLLVVWVSDIGGYVAGRGIGGPKLWPESARRRPGPGRSAGLRGAL